jgi:hypothetical protein
MEETLEEIIIRKLEIINKENIPENVRNINNELICICKASIQEAEMVFKK